jgi:hypothetical protein
MPLMLSELYDALLDAGASEEKARKAAEAAAVVDTRFAAPETRMTQLEGRMTALEGRMHGLEGRMTMLMWMVGLNLTLTLGVLWRLLKP